MNLYRRGMIFMTFLGSCLCIGLLGAALGTKYWIMSSAKRMPNGVIHKESDGRIHFGLFSGVKELNVGYGWRTDFMDISKLLKTEPDFMIYSLWLGTVVCVCGGLLFAACCAVFAVINTATTPIGMITGIPGLYLWNMLSISLQCSALGLWGAQYFKKLQYNVVTAEDRGLFWSSDGMAFFGHSYWLVAASITVHLINIIFIYTGTSDLRRKKAVKPVLEEKPNGAIMLY